MNLYKKSIYKMQIYDETIDVFVTYPQGQNQRKTKKYAGKYTRNKYLYRVFAASFILLISGNKPISIPL